MLDWTDIGLMVTFSWGRGGEKREVWLFCSTPIGTVTMTWPAEVTPLVEVTVTPSSAQSSLRTSSWHSAPASVASHTVLSDTWGIAL